jgi:hypothetical protein
MSTPNPVPTIATWTDPTTNTDGSPIAPGEITSFTLGVRDTTAAGSVAGTYPFSVSAPPTATSEPLNLIKPVLPTGVLLAAAMRTDTAGPSSAWTNEVTFTLPKPLPVPNPPSAFGIA